MPISASLRTNFKAVVNTLDWLPLRYAVYGGLLSSVGVTLGWLLWIALQVFRHPQHRRDVVLAALVGAVVGLLWEWLCHYRAVALRETGQVSSPLEDEDEGEPGQTGEGVPQYGAAVRIGAFTVGALGVVCEHLAADLIHGVLLPFVTSLALLFPVGVIFALALRYIVWDDSGVLIAFASRAGGGVLLGLAAALVTYGMRAAMHLAASSGGTSGGGWWVILGLGFTFSRACALRPWTPLRGVLLALVLVLIICKWQEPLARMAATLDHGPLTVVPFTVTALSTASIDALSSPDLPEQSWRQAEQQVAREEVPTEGLRAASSDSAGKPVTPPRPAQWAQGLCTWLGCPPPPAPHPVTTSLPPSLTPGLALALRPLRAPPPLHPIFLLHPRHIVIPQNLDMQTKTLGGYVPSEQTPVWPSAAERAMAEPLSTAPEVPISDRIKALTNRSADTDDDPFIIAGSPRERLCTDLSQDSGAGLVRSWLVILCFSLGLGAAAPLEAHYRPPDYAASQTRHNDWILLGITLALIAAAIVLCRAFPQGLA